MSDDRAPRHVKVFAELDIEVTDDAEVRRTAVADMRETEFGEGVDGQAVAEVREVEFARVADDLANAVQWLVDPVKMLDEVDGLEFVGPTHHAVEVDDDGLEFSADPDFVALFPVCHCGGAVARRTGLRRRCRARRRAG